LQIKWEIKRLETGVIDPQTLVARALPEKLGTEDVEGPAWDSHLPTDGEVRIGEVNRQEHIVILHGRTEE
jgi:hypothetical protein